MGGGRLGQAIGAEEQREAGGGQANAEDVGIGGIEQGSEQPQAQRRAEGGEVPARLADSLAAQFAGGQRDAERRQVREAQHHLVDGHAGQVAQKGDDEKVGGGIKVVDLRMEGRERGDGAALLDGERQVAEALRVGVQGNGEDEGRRNEEDRQRAVERPRPARHTPDGRPQPLRAARLPGPDRQAQGERGLRRQEHEEVVARQRRQVAEEHNPAGHPQPDTEQWRVAARVEQRGQQQARHGEQQKRGDENQEDGHG